MLVLKKHATLFLTHLIISFILLAANCSAIKKETNIYDKKITQKGALLYFQESFYFFPLKHKNIRAAQDLFTKNIKQLNGFRCEGFLRSINTYELLMNMDPSDVTLFMCEYEGVKTHPNYFEIDDFRMSLVKMTYQIHTPTSYDKIIMEKTIGYCIKIPESEHTVKFKI